MGEQPAAADPSARWRADDGRLVVGRCTGCRQVHHYPREICPFCGAAAIELVGVSGSGIVHSFTYSRNREGVVDRIPAFVRLDEQVTLVTEIVGEIGESLSIGDRVSVRFGADGAPRFRREHDNSRLTGVVDFDRDTAKEQD